VKQSYFFLISLLVLTACGGQENKSISTKQEMTNRLIVPPCHR